MVMRRSIWFVFVLFTVQAQTVIKPLTQIDACKFADTIVRIDSDTMSGTGVIVDPDGWIVTAMHVVANQKTLAPYGNIAVTANVSKKAIPAEIRSPLDQLTAERDFAILKIDRRNLPHIEIEEHQTEFPLGSPIAIIGLPISARFGERLGPVPKFCFSGTIAAQEAIRGKRLEFIRRIYFQGVSVKGISGAPVVLLESGKIVGIVSTKLTGISRDLDDARSRILAGKNQGITVIAAGADLGDTLGSLIDTLDTQLANGLGGATQTEDISEALNKAKREYQRQKR